MTLTGTQQDLLFWSYIKWCEHIACHHHAPEAHIAEKDNLSLFAPWYRLDRGSFGKRLSGNHIIYITVS